MNELAFCEMHFISQSYRNAILAERVSSLAIASVRMPFERVFDYVSYRGFNRYRHLGRLDNLSLKPFDNRNHYSCEKTYRVLLSKCQVNH
jgi:hypothetical protein